MADQPGWDHQPGKVLEHGERRYRIEAGLHHGLFGAVYHCRDEWGGALIARVLKPFSRSYSRIREAWLEEGEKLPAVQHPNLVFLHDSFELDGVYHLISERVSYRLEDYITLPTWRGEAWFLTVAASVLAALDRIHREGFWHRNLHPHNLGCRGALELATPETAPAGTIVLCDFGVGHLLGNVDVFGNQLAQWLTPPEFLKPSAYGGLDHRVDLYQCGLLLLSVLLGRSPRFNYAEVEAGKAQKLALELKSSYGPVLARALSPKVDERFPSARAFWRALGGGAFGMEEPGGR